MRLFEIDRRLTDERQAQHRRNQPKGPDEHRHRQQPAEPASVAARIRRSTQAQTKAPVTKPSQ
jgi:hypothetical protein